MTKSEETAFVEGLKGTAVLRSGGGGEPVVAAERASDARIPPGSGYQLRTVPVATLPGGQVQVVTGVNPTPAPTSLGYSKPSALYSVGQPIMSNQPASTGGVITSFSVSPALPAGLSLDTISGVISGTPQNLQPATTYTIAGSNAAGTASATVSIAVVAPGSFQPTGSMVLGRSAATATLLSDGRVLIVGGYVGPGGFDPPTRTAELYDPSTGQWKLTGSMRDAREFHTATLLPNGKVLVAGGIDSDPFTSRSLSTAELYDPATGLWTATGSMNRVRDGHTATLLADGKVLVMGSRDPGGNASTAELYNPATGLWTETGSMNGARASHTATLLTDGKVLVFGGASSGFALATAELYDPATGTWTATGSTIEPRIGHAATLLQNGKVLAAGGLAGLQALRTAEVYDPSNGQWTATTTSMTDGRTHHTATLLADGKVLVLGGTSDGGNTHPLGMELYNPTTDQWAVSGSMSEGRLGHTAIRLLDGMVLVAGGIRPSLLLNTAYLYVPLP
ncbi:kelch repeat-containing protein [Variovorax sp. MHTC-1]|uniref:kelch repeat-containing protein n=1 Tax=Variovorax sp. MHTC-1 TaxID=2495593 RepID=UPI0021B02594|nr:kelch repeat-containing protein [Variovorax sp. MHTC-1]